MKLRLKLSDFIGTDLEPVIMNKIKQIENELRIKIILNLWYDDGEIESVKLKDFILKWEKTLSIKTVIQISNEIFLPITCGSLTIIYFLISNLLI